MSQFTAEGAAAPEAAVVAEIATRAAVPTRIEKLGVPTVFTVPEGARIEVADVDRFIAYEDHPRRTSGTFIAHTVDSLGDYIAEHQRPDATTVWVDLENYAVEAVINDHPTSITEGFEVLDVEPGWGDHRARVQLRTSPEWDTWTGQNDQLLPQDAFAAFIEQNLGDIVQPDDVDDAPTQADMYETARELHAKSGVDFASKVELDSGAATFKYEETTSASVGRGSLEVPRTFYIGIPSFIGEDPVVLTARLRWRPTPQGLFLGYVLLRPHLVLDDAMRRVADRLTLGKGEQEDLGFRRVYHGKPAAARRATPSGL